MEEETKTEKSQIINPDTTEKKQDTKFKPGQSGNPKGRPKGSISIKDKVRQHLEDNPEEVEEIVKHFVKKNRELMWQMLEGRPQQDVTSGGEKLPQPLLHVLYNNSSSEDKPAEEAN